MPARLDWRTFAAFLHSAGRDSAYARAKLGEEVQWGLSEHLLARVSDQLANLQWSLAGGKGARPKPVKRPAAKGEVQSFGQGESWTAESLLEWIELVEAGR